MVTKEFLEEYPLFRKLKVETPELNVENWKDIPINMECLVCKSMQTFNMVFNYSLELPGKYNGNASNRVFDLRFVCQSCKNFQRRFFVYVNPKGDSIHKVGQYPEWEIKIDKGLEKTLGRHVANYRKGLVCESQGYGIGAFSYYRRITEDIIDEMLNSISDLIEEEHKKEYSAALEKTKQTRVAQDKIDLVKDLLPGILRPNGVNPLSVLHSELSKGIHSESDEDCLEISKHIKSILIFLINQIIQSKDSAKTFSESMKSLLDKRAAK